MKNNKEVQAWIDETRRAYNILKTMPKTSLKVLANLGGLDLNHYTTKSLLAKGLMIKLGTVLPIEMKKWKNP